MHARPRFGHLRSCLLATALTVVPLVAQAGDVLPTGGNYVAGKGTIAGAGSGLTINQSSTTGIIDWSSFSIGQGNAVQFNNGSGATLNRVTGPDMARIGGSLTATGSIFLIDPQGVVISNTGRVVTGGSFVGSTRDISNSDFLSGNLHFTGSSSGNVINRGQIRSTGGDAVLIGNSVQNTGTLSAPKGTAGMAAGNDVLLQPVGGDQRIFVKGGKGDVRNSGTVSSASAELKAAGGNVYSLAGNNGGIINATGTQTINGHVWLTSNTGNVTVSGNISAKNVDGSGGTIVASGHTTTLTASAKISASGTKGGTILIGGDVHGGANSAENFVSGKVATSQYTNIAKGASLSADASQGQGGNIVVWSDSRTDFAGTISAKGAHSSGGFSEVSSHKLLGFTGHVDLTSAFGKSGTLLLDPENVTISNGATSNGSIGGGSFTPSGDNSVLNVTDLQNALSTANVIVTTGGSGSPGSQTGDISVIAPITWSANTLTLDAYHSININAAMSATGTAGLTLTTNDGGTGGDYSFNGGSVSFANTGEALTINGQAYTLLNNLAAVQAINTNSTTLSGHYALAQSLDGTSYSGWIPIGNSGSMIPTDPPGTGFTGSFEGLGNTISNLAIAPTFDNGGGPQPLAYVGLFGVSHGAIRDIGMIGGSVTGVGDVGALVGYNAGTVSGSFAETDVLGAGSQSSNYVGVSIGGLVGYNDGGSISNSSATGLIDGVATNSGGLLGYNNNGTVSGSFATGNNTAHAAPYGGFGGGLVGYNNSGTISGSFATGDVGGGIASGGLVGQDSAGTIIDSYATGNIDTVVSAGGLVGFGTNGGTITNSYATGTVTGFNNSYNGVGGLAGRYDGTISSSYATGAVHGRATSNGTVNGIGGLVGLQLGGAIENSYATGAVSGGYYQGMGGLAGYYANGTSLTDSYATGAVTGAVNGGGLFTGGLVGWSGSGSISQSYATGAVSSDANNAIIGGLAGYSRAVISDAYAMGMVSAASSNQYAGGLVGTNAGAIHNSFATGQVLGGSLLTIGGLVGYNNLGTITHSYWDTQTSGLSAGIGLDDNAQSGNVIGRTTAQLQGTLPSGFSSGVWGTGTGLFPYFLWQYASTPQAVSGIAYSDAGLTPLSSGSVSLLVNGNAFGTAFSGANGYYYFLLAPNTIPALNGEVLTYLSGTGGASLAQNPAGSVANLDILNGFLSTNTADTTYSAFRTDLTSALASATGSYSSVLSLVNALPNLAINVTAPNFAIDQAVNLGSGVLKLTDAAGPVTQSAAITAYQLWLQGGANFMLNNAANSISRLAANVGGISLTDNATLWVNTEGPTNGVTSAGTLSLTTIGSGHNLSLYGAMTGNTVNLVSAGTLNQSSAGVITATTLTGSTNGGVVLTTAVNAITNLGAFSTANHGFALSDAATLSVMGAVNAGTGNLALTTTGAGHNLSVYGSLTGGIVNLVSAGTINQNSAGIITATTLTGSSNGGVVLTPAANVITNLGAFSTANHSFALSDAHTLTVTGAVDVGSASMLALTTTGVGHNLAINNTLTGGTINLASAGSINQNSAGILAGTTLTGSSNGDVTLTAAANAIANLGAFVTASHNFALSDAATLAVTGSVNAGTGNLTLTTTGAGHNLAINNALTGATLNLVSAGGISQNSAGILTATSLTGSSNGDVTLTAAANAIANLGAFVTASHNFALSDAATLAVTGAVNTATGNLSLTTAGAGHNLSANGALTGNTVTLVSAGTLNQNSSGVITATTLKGSSNGSVALTTAANVITNLGAFSTAGNNFALSDAATLAVTGAVNAGAGNLSLTTTGAGHNLSAYGSLTGNTVTLVSAGTLNQNSAGVINATTLTGFTNGGVALTTAANAITNLGAFSTGNRNFALRDAHTLTVTGAVNAGTGNLTLTTTGATHNLVINNALTGSTISLVSAGTLGQNGSGILTGTTLTGGAAGTTTLTAANRIANLSDFNVSVGDMSFTDAQALNVIGAVKATDASSVLSLTTSSGDLHVTGTGFLTAATINLAAAAQALEDSTGVINTNLINVTADTGINLIGSANNITNIGTNHTNSGPDVINQ